MDESGKNQTIKEALFGLFFIFLILIFLIYKFGYNQSSVENTDTQTNTADNISQQDFEDSLNPANSGGENSIYFKYIKKIYDEQNLNGKDANIDAIINDYKNELANSVALPGQVVTLTRVSPTYNKAEYNTSFETAFSSLKSKGGTSESKIFQSQIVDKDTLIPLSDYDKETLLRLATEYELFANQISSLKTPTAYQRRGEATIKASLNVAYILRKMADTTDTKVYSLWIGKYSEVMFDILASRSEI